MDRYDELCNESSRTFRRLADKVAKATMKDVCLTNQILDAAIEHAQAYSDLVVYTRAEIDANREESPGAAREFDSG